MSELPIPEYLIEKVHKYLMELVDYSKQPHSSAADAFVYNLIKLVIKHLNTSCFEDMLLKNNKLKKRLEASDEHSYDGIYTRDETIRLQDEEIKRLKEKTTWQDISTAPKDNKKILVGWELCNDIDYTATARYYKDWNSIGDSQWIEDCTDTELSEPTHWMEIPEFIGE